MINLLADTMQGMLTRLRSEAGRSTFSNQLVEALEMADSEAEADRVIARAMSAISDVHPMELLLADSSRAHLERACVHPKTGSPNCAVESPYSCIAVRRGHPQIFPDAEALNACPKLLGRMGGSLSAACVPVNFMGRALGVLHVTGAKGKPPNPEQIAQLTALGVHAGNRIGTLRAFERSQLQASTDSLTGLTNRRAAEEVLAQSHGASIRRSPWSWPISTSSSASTTRRATTPATARSSCSPIRRAAWCAIAITWCAGAARNSRCCCRARMPSAPPKSSVVCAPRSRRRTCCPNTPIFTASFGISDSTMARDRETLIRLADEALYRSKQAGRDCCTIGDPQLTGPPVMRRERDQGAVVDITQVARGS